MRRPVWFDLLTEDDKKIVLAALWAAFHDNHSVLDNLDPGLHERGEKLAVDLNAYTAKLKP